MRDLRINGRKFRVRFTGRYRRAAGLKIPMYRSVWIDMEEEE